MKKSILVILILIALLIPITYSYAIESLKVANKEEAFFETSKLEYNKNEKVEMTINLEQIKYNKFVFELQSSENMQNVEINSNENSKTLVAKKSVNEIVIEIDKLTTNLNTITLYYQIPEQMQINDTIKFTATITNMETQENTETEENKQEEIKLEINNNQENNSGIKVESESETKIVEIKIVEQKNETNIDNKNEENSQNNMPNNNQKSSNQNNTTSQKINMTTSSSNKSISSMPTVTYKGSDNNYLSKLSVEGYELNKEFSKENSTYFLTVENNVESLNVEWTKDDITSTVCIYGNEELTTGTNKILISVTAENGNVRTYRIYVTKNS